MGPKDSIAKHMKWLKLAYVLRYDFVHAVADFQQWAADDCQGFGHLRSVDVFEEIYLFSAQ